MRTAGLVLAVLAAVLLLFLIGTTTGENPSAEVMMRAVLSSLGLFGLAALLSLGRHALLNRSASLPGTNRRDTTGPGGPLRRYLSLWLGLSYLVLALLWVVPPLITVTDGEIIAALAALTPPALLLTIGVWHQVTLARTLWTELNRRTFTGTAPELPASAFTARRSGVLAAIDREQFSHLVLYNEDNPFLGAGSSYHPWSLTLELERRPDHPGPPDGADSPDEADPPDGPDSPEGAGSPASPDGTGPLDGRRVLELIAPRLAGLAEVSSRTSRDRLKDLEMQECVFLPASLPRDVRRVGLPYGDGGVREHLTESLGEGAEQRRHFLRIRVGGWEEEVVTTVFVRVHTQGDLLILEVLPYVLPPLRPVFHEVDALTERSTRLRPSTLMNAPSVAITALAGGASALSSWCVEWFGSAGEKSSEAPRLNIRELASRDSRSMFQEMDVSRYVRTIQDRITSGTRQALAEAGYKTEEFQQQIVNISRGGVFIGGSMTGSIATGDGGTAVTATGPTAKETKDKR